MANMRLDKNPMPIQDAEIRNKNFSEVALGYTTEQAIDEAKRCLNCKNKPCVTQKHKHRRHSRAQYASLYSFRVVFLCKRSRFFFRSAFRYIRFYRQDGRKVFLHIRTRFCVGF